MQIRQATIADIPELHTIRMAVKENILSDPELVSQQDYINFLTTDGMGWVCEVNGIIAGFAILDLKKNNVWALFVSPEFEGQGIGRKLHATMLNWYFAHYQQPLNLSTEADTRAESFYRQAGWTETDKEHNIEIRFVIAASNWRLT